MTEQNMTKQNMTEQNMTEQKTRKKKTSNLKLYYQKDELEVGVDEVARGCLAGRVYSAAVIWPQELDSEEIHPIIKDSKKLSARRRLILKDYIEETAIDYSVAWEDEKTIDEINILNATYNAMHRALDGLDIEVDRILVDGDKFRLYRMTPHICIPGGDAKYIPIAAASILAKVYHDQYIDKLLEEDPDLKKYGWETNMCYGTTQHMDAIRKYGLSKYHRKTFGICQEYC